VLFQPIFNIVIALD